MKFVSLIPARSGSQRIKDKNMRKIGGKSLIERSVSTSLKSSMISQTLIVTDSKCYEDHAVFCGAESLGLRPAETASSSSPDITWIKWVLNNAITQNPLLTHYIVLRPTSPFRTLELIENAIETYIKCDTTSQTTLRCISRASEHPFKMWTSISNKRVSRLFPFETNGVFMTDQQSSTLPKVFVQNAAIEIGSISNILESSSTSGSDVIGFEWNGIEVFDINTPQDLEYAEFLATVKKI